MSNTKSILKDSKYLKHTYSEDLAPKSSYPDLLSKWLLDNVYNKVGKILDFGCGRGDYLDSFKHLSFDSYGVDISPSVDDLSEHTIKRMDMECDELPYEAEEFDFVFSKSVIEHVNDPHFFLKGIHDALKPGGKAVIMTPSWSHTYWGPFYIDHTHVSPYTKFSLKTVLEMSGFKNVKVIYFYQLPFLWKHTWMVPFAQLFAKLPIPYSPYNDVPWKTSNWFNKLVRFSKEAMLLAVVEK